MHPFTRGACPELLEQYGREVGEKYKARRETKPNARFRWPKRQRQSLYDSAHAAALRDTDGHCAYCDGNRLGAHGREELDHFRPSTGFPLLACEWSNLFLSCTTCNAAKNDQWDESLLRADDTGFSFERYFSFRADNGAIEPNLRASPEDQRRAEVTIRLFNLNRIDLCVLRRRELGRKDADAPYRFLQR